MTGRDGMRDPPKENLVVRRSASGRIDGLPQVLDEEGVVLPTAERVQDAVEIRRVPVSPVEVLPESEHEAGSVGKA